jgi:hypothetical protein
VNGRLAKPVASYLVGLYGVPAAIAHLVFPSDASPALARLAPLCALEAMDGCGMVQSVQTLWVGICCWQSWAAGDVERAKQRYNPGVLQTPHR